MTKLIFMNVSKIPVVFIPSLFLCVQHPFNMSLSINRFRCQLAIQEVNYNQIDTDIYPTHHHGLSQHIHTQSVHSSCKNLNFEFAVDFDSERRKKSIATNTESETVIEMEELPLAMRHRSDSAHGRLQRSDIDRAHGRLQCSKNDSSHGKVRSCEFHLREAVAQELKENLECFDTFEHCLHVSNQMESIMAYYYQEEGHKDCFKFEEIYALRDTDESVPLDGLSKQNEVGDLHGLTAESRERSLSLGEVIRQTPYVQSDLEEFFEDKSNIMSYEKETQHVQDRHYDLL